MVLGRRIGTKRPSGRRLGAGGSSSTSGGLGGGGHHNGQPQGAVPPPFLGTEALIGTAIDVARIAGSLSARAFALQQRRAAAGITFITKVDDFIVDPILGWVVAADPTPGNIASGVLVTADQLRKGALSFAAWGLQKQAQSFNRLAQWLW